MTDDTDGEFAELVHKLREQPEREWVEFKQNFPRPDRLGEYISALSNSAALHQRPKGYLVFGIDDSSLEVVGTKFDLPNEKYQRQNLWLVTKSKLKPEPITSYKEGVVDGKRVAVLEICCAKGSPTFIGDVAWIRIGSHNQKLSSHPVEATALYRKLDSTPFELHIAAESQTLEQVADKIDHNVYRALTGVPFDTPQQDFVSILESSQIIIRRDSGRFDITNLGALMFARNFRNFPDLARKAPRVVRYIGTGKTEGESEHEGVMGYACGFVKIVDYIMKKAPRRETFAKVLRTSETPYPRIAIREAVGNILMHQDFSMSGTGPLVEIYDDRIEFTNPGIPSIETDRFVDQKVQSCNEKLARLMRICDMAEERGSGWDRIVESTEESLLPPPSVFVGDTHTVVTLYGPRPLSEMSKEDRTRAVYLHACLLRVKQKTLTNSSLRERFGLPDNKASTVTTYINQALDAGVIARLNTGRKLAQYAPWWAKEADTDDQLPE